MNLKEGLIIIGAGGHGRVVAEAAQLSGLDVVGFVDRDVGDLPDVIDGVSVLGDDEWLAANAKNYSGFTIGVGLAQVSDLRRALFSRFRKLGLEPLQVIHPRAIVSDKAQISPGVQILANSVVQQGAVVQENVIINTSAVVEHDCYIGANSHVAPGALVLGGARVDDQCLIGAGAVVMPNVEVKAKVTVRAGSIFVGEV